MQNLIPKASSNRKFRHHTTTIKQKLKVQNYNKKLFEINKNILISIDNILTVSISGQTQYSDSL